jgi:hypothetical protein
MEVSAKNQSIKQNKNAAPTDDGTNQWNNFSLKVTEYDV